jgi:hypothetical protein
VTGTASDGGRESWKEAAFFDTATNRRVYSIPAGWYVQEVLEVPSVAVACGGTIGQAKGNCEAYSPLGARLTRKHVQPSQTIPQNWRRFSFLQYHLSRLPERLVVLSAAPSSPTSAPSFGPSASPSSSPSSSPSGAPSSAPSSEPNASPSATQLLSQCWSHFRRTTSLPGGCRSNWPEHSPS